MADFAYGEVHEIQRDQILQDRVKNRILEKILKEEQQEEDDIVI